MPGSRGRRGDTGTPLPCPPVRRTSAQTPSGPCRTLPGHPPGPPSPSRPCPSPSTVHPTHRRPAPDHRRRPQSRSDRAPLHKPRVRPPHDLPLFPLRSRPGDVPRASVPAEGAPGVNRLGCRDPRLTLSCPTGLSRISLPDSSPATDPRGREIQTDSDSLPVGGLRGPSPVPYRGDSSPHVCRRVRVWSP